MKPTVAWVGLNLMLLFMGLAMTDPNFAAIVAKPDNVPIVGLVFLLGYFTWLGAYRAVQNDDRLKQGLEPLEKQDDEKVFGMAGLGVYRVDLHDRDHRAVAGLGDRSQGAAGGASQRDEDAESIQGAVVLSRSSGDAGLLRSVDGWSGLAKSCCFWADGDSIP